MRLFLCSSFITKEIQKDFESLINRPMDGLKIASIITSSKGYKKVHEKADMSWLNEDLEIARNNFHCIVDLFDIEEMTKKERKVFLNYDVIWMEGGLTKYLIEAIRKTGFDKELLDLLEVKPYIGTSAGSMVCSESLDASEWYIGDPEKGITKLKGLGFIDFQIYPHFRDELLEDIKKARRKDQEYWLLKNGQAVSIDIEKKEFIICGGNIIKLERVV